jgi:hypothetical protein
MVELAIGPHNRVMAGIARQREIGSRVIHRRLGIVVIRLVATHASHGRDVVATGGIVAIHAGARRHQVRSAQGKAGRCVIELAIGPENRVMAGLARRRELRTHVVNRTRSCVVVGSMARDTQRAAQGVPQLSRVAIRAGAWRHHVRASERPVCRRHAMVECCSQP